MGIFFRILKCVEYVPAIVQAVESLFSGKPGAEKKAAAITLVGDALSCGEVVGGKEVVNEEKFKLGLGKIIDGVVDCLNASVWAKK